VQLLTVTESESGNDRKLYSCKTSVLLRLSYIYNSDNDNDKVTITTIDSYITVQTR